MLMYKTWKSLEMTYGWHLMVALIIQMTIYCRILLPTKVFRLHIFGDSIPDGMKTPTPVENTMMEQVAGTKTMGTEMPTILVVLRKLPAMCIPLKAENSCSEHIMPAQTQLLKPSLKLLGTKLSIIPTFLSGLMNIILQQSAVVFITTHDMQTISM